MIALIGAVTALRAGYRSDRGVAVVPRALRRLLCWTAALAVELLGWALFPLLGLLIVPLFFLYVVALCLIGLWVNEFYRSRKQREDSPIVIKYYPV